MIEVRRGGGVERVTPEIQSAASVGDVRRVIVRGADAVAQERDRLRKGRQSTGLENPLETLRQINESIDHKV